MQKIVVHEIKIKKIKMQCVITYSIQNILYTHSKISSCGLKFRTNQLGRFKSPVKIIELP